MHRTRVVASKFVLSLPMLLALSACPGGGGGNGSTGGESTGGTSTAGTTEPEPTSSTSTTAPDPTTTGTTTSESETDGTTTTGEPVDPEPPGTLVKSDKDRDLTPDISPQDLAAMAEDERVFATALFAALEPGDTNRAISPTSIRFAFGQTYAGARTISKTEIETAVKFSLAPEVTHAALNQIDLELETRNAPPSGEIDGDDSIHLALVNQVFGRPGIPWEPAFLDILAESYGTGMHELDFADSEPSRMAINAWVNAVTKDKIPELLPVGAIFPQVTTVLVNALYLKAPWATGFESVTEDTDFTRLNNSTAKVAMMRGRQDGARHFAGAAYEAVEIPLRGGELTMVVILPLAGTFEAFAGGLDGAALGQIFASLQPAAVEVELPRFKFSTDLKLKPALQQLGMLSSFELGGGDFSGMAPEGSGWAISDVYHDVFVGVDEKGIEAAAASAVVVFDSGDPGPEAFFTADRPFLFAVRDRGTDSLLFLGRVLDPSK